MTITPEQLHILQHSLGVDCYGCGRQYRNRYISDPNNDLSALCGLGLMKNYGPWEVPEAVTSMPLLKLVNK